MEHRPRNRAEHSNIRRNQGRCPQRRRTFYITRRHNMSRHTQRFAPVFIVARRPGRSTPFRHNISPHRPRKANDIIRIGRHRRHWSNPQTRPVNPFRFCSCDCGRIIGRTASGTGTGEIGGRKNICPFSF